ncbi:PVC-type heme-binding CxxCH protein [Blastopirellula marina]|nr:PVC-type heme-binding CxxCH protein [Blastopirellula marina]
MNRFRVADGFHVELAAAEPNVVDPVAMAFDADGRLFVIEMRGYSEDDGQMLGRVRMLEDLDDDGTYEKSTIFAEGFSWPTAIFCTQGGILVGAAPEIYWLKDEDGDGKADTRQVLFTGFRSSNVQGLLNTFQWGLDNRIHGVTSSSGGQVQKVVDGQAVGSPISLRGRDFEIDPLTMEMKAISGGGQHGMSMNQWGDKFTCNNSDHLQQIVYEDRYIARNPYVASPSARKSIAVDGGQASVFRTSPVEAWRVIRTELRTTNVVPGPIEGGGTAAGYFTSATGITIFRGDGWPAKYHGFAIVGDVGSNLVHRKQLNDQGILYQGVRIDDNSEFLSSQDIWFRPVQFANAPDGSLYVADMYREVIEHPEALPPMIKKHLDLTSGRDRGRIYRIVGDDFKRRPTEHLSQVTTKDLVGFLEHSNDWQRETAARLIYERQDAVIATDLANLAASSTRAESRILALAALAGLNKITPKVLLTALDDPHPRVRQHAIRLAEPLIGSSPVLRKKISSLVNDPNPHVRFQLAFTLGMFPIAEKTPLLAKLVASDGADPYARAAIQSSVTEGAGAFLLEITQEATPNNEMISLLANQIGKQRKPDDVAAILKQLPRLQQQSPKLFEQIVKGLNADPGSELARQLAKATQGDASEVIDKMVRNAHQIVSDEQANLIDRLKAVEVLRFGKFEASRFAALLQPTQPLELQQATLKVLRQFDSPDVAALIVSNWPSMGPGLRTQAMDVLTSRPKWVGTLLDAIQSTNIPLADVGLSRLEQLAPLLSEEQRKQIANLKANATQSDRTAIVDDFRKSLTMSGDADRGKQVFAKNCSSCHQMNGVGHPLGPNLAAMKNRGTEAILVNVLLPNAEVNPQYMNYICLTTDGRTVSGMLASETATSITLVQADDKSETILRIDIDQLRSTGVSLMPEGLEKSIDQQAMADLLIYLTQ